MITGIVLGGCFGLFGFLWVLAIIDTYEVYKKIIYFILMILTITIPIIIGAKIGIYEDKNNYLKAIAEYTEKKKVYETALQDNTFSDLEKISLVSDISYINKSLAETKIEYKKWHYWYLDYSLIEELEPIDIESK